ADVDPPKAVRPRIEAWTTQEMHRFLGTAAGDGYGPIWLVALTTGLRKGELLGLRWCDVELDRAVLHVRQQIVSVNGRLITGEPKTAAGRRTIALPRDCVEALREHQGRRPRRPVALDPAHRDTDPVFASAVGTSIEPRNASARFDALVARSGVQRISFHGMRHTHATLLLLSGINVKIVSERLGHASIAITLDTYAHLLPGMQESAAEAMQKALQHAV
ncbi:MAG TPA: site-specific integrase, partial [Chloroflexota bacterium]|nr:site-specific integrase [Chloroflexota bacterium]